MEVTGGGGATAAEDFLPLLAAVDVDGGGDGGAEAVEDFLPFFFGSAGGGVGGSTVGGGGAAAADFLGLPIVCNTN